MEESLKEYRNKRNFKVTAEPDGKKRRVAEKNSGLKFAVQYHIARRVHYDLRLEWNGVLLSWAVPKGPSYNPKDKRLAVKVEDHPLDYADFEGLIPKGEYGGGTVMLWDEGSWTPFGDVDEGLKSGSLKLELDGARLKGRWALVSLKAEGEEDDDNWLLIKEKDEYCLTSPGIDGYTTSVKTGRSVEQINRDEDPAAKTNPFGSAAAQLARLVDSPPEGDDWLFEVKYDGYRIMAFTEGGKTRLITRNDIDFTAKFKSVAATVTSLAAGRAMVLDGEIVVADGNGRTDFQALQQYVKKPDGKALTYMVFDLLALDGEDLRELPLIERKQKLAAVLEGAPENVRLSAHIAGRGAESLAAAQKLGLEGVVGKRADSPYVGGKNGDWIKVKCYKRQEFVLGGYTRSQKREEGISSLLLGVYEDGKLICVGRAGTGLNRLNTRELEKEFKKAEAVRPPFGNPPRPKGGEEIKWLKPRLVAEVQFAEVTNEGVLRQASFKGLRRDKNPEEVIMETVKTAETDVKAKKAKKPTAAKAGAKGKARPEAEVLGVAISNPDKVVYRNPLITKLDVARYYEAVASRMLKYAGNRVLSVVRCHKGISDECFFKKHPAGEGENVEVVAIRNSEGVVRDYFYVKRPEGLVREAQMGSLEFHVWGSRADDLEHPDMMVFDFDPDEGIPLERVRQGVKDLKKILDKLNLKSFLKTSGGKGYHVVVPFRAGAGWEEFSAFARSIAKLMESKWPELYTCNMRKIKRKGKVFIDWERNGRGHTSVAPYSLRARPGARVSMPIAWSELNKIAPDEVDLPEALKRLKKSDPWKDFFKADQQLRLPDSPV